LRCAFGRAMGKEKVSDETKPRKWKMCSALALLRH
jgi:hypothetical protein